MTAGSMCGDTHQNGGKAPSMGSDMLSFGRREGHVPDLRIDQAVLGHEAEVDVGILGAKLLGEIAERLAAGERRLGSIGRRLVLEGKLLQAAPLGRVVGVLRFLVPVAISASVTSILVLRSSTDRTSTPSLRYSGEVNSPLLAS